MNNNEISLEGVYTSELISFKFYRITKRLFDIFVSIIGILVTLIILFFVKIAYLASGDTKRLILHQKRIGKNGKIFKIYKIRTMIPNAEKYLFEVLFKENPELKKEYLENKKLENDPRITKVGKLIRKLSLDEFPQFMNVFKGEMSVVGPRPYLPYERDDMGSAYEEIIKVKPGITGPWQVGGRNDIAFKERTILDRKYSENQSFREDIKIFFKTFSTIITKKGAK